MSSSLLISLDGIQVEQVQQVVQARGIDKVIVAGSSAGFSSGNAIAGINAAAQIKRGGTPVELAVADTGTLALDALTTAAIQASGLTFLSDSGLASLTDAVLATDSFIASPTPDAPLPNYVPGTVATLDGGLQLKSNIGEAPVLSPVAGITELRTSAALSASTFRQPSSQHCFAMEA